MSLVSAIPFTLAAVVTPAGTINQISSHAVDPGLNNLVAHSDGQVDPTFAAVQTQKPTASFTTTAIARALGFAGWSGLAVTAGVDLWFQRLAQGGTRAGASAHSKYTFSHGLLVPTSISWENEGPATIDYQFWARSNDGTTSPLSITTGASLPSLVTTREFFTAGPASINGTSVPVSGGRLDFGFEPVVEGSDGEAYPTFCGIMRRNPVLTLRTLDANLASTIGITVGQGATDSVVYLRKFLAGGTRVANATAEHVKFTVDDGIVSVRGAGGGDGQVQETSIEIQCIYDGSNDAIAISAASAIA